MPDALPTRKWRFTRHCLCGMRIGFLLVVLVAVALLGYLNLIGLPPFLKKPLVNALHTRGVDLEFSRLRWRWYRGIVADNVRFGAAQPGANVPQVSFKQAEVRLNHSALARFNLKVDSLLLRGGQVVWRIEETNQPPESLSVTNIQTQLRLLPGDQWELDKFTASFAGARVQLSGSITNASALRDWSIFHSQGEAQPGALRRRLRELAKTIDRLKFPEPPDLNVNISGDARVPKSFHGLLSLQAPGARTPWGTLANVFLDVHLFAPDDASPLSKVDFDLRAGEAETRWAGTRNFHLNIRAAGDASLTNLVRATLEMSAARFTSKLARGTNLQVSARWTHSLTNPIPTAGTVNLHVADVWTPRAIADEVRLSVTLVNATNHSPAPADAIWGWWAALEPYVLDWNCHLVNIHADPFKAPELVCSGRWSAPELTLTNLHTEMYGGRVDASADLNVATRVARFAGISDFDVLQALPLLTPTGRDWFLNQEFEWTQPPVAHASGSVILPAWTNSEPARWEEMRPTLVLQGDFKVGEAGFHHIPVSSARSHFTYTNMVWNLPDLVVTRPEGKVEIEHVSDDKTKEYYFHIRSGVDVKVVRPLLNPAGQRVLDELTFSQPPVIDGEIWGLWHDYSRTGGRAEVTLTNFSYRDEAANFFHGSLAYTNEFLLLTNARVERTNQYATAEGVGFDFKGKKGYLTNGFSTLDPLALLHSIGPKVTKQMEPYHFLQPPTASAYGVIPLSEDISVADLHFKIDGGPFEWLRFHVPHISGQVDWVGEGMTLKDMRADFYNGKLTGSALFDFHPEESTLFSFDTVFTDVSLGALMTGLGEGTNHLEGTLSGHLNISHANSADTNSWFGSGQAELRDGLIWEIPIFGILSPLLDSIVDGWGKTRISDASANFVITNSVIRSDDLELRSPTLHLFYRGTVDFNMNVDAKVNAEVALAGSLVAKVLSPFSGLFETHVTGTLRNPKRTPATLAGKFLNPFMHPFRTFSDFLHGEPDASATSAPGFPPDKPPPP